MRSWKPPKGESGNSRLGCAEEAIIKGQTCYFSFSYQLRSAVASEPDGRGLEHVSGLVHLSATENRQSNSLTGCSAPAKRSPDVWMNGGGVEDAWRSGGDGGVTSFQKL